MTDCAEKGQAVASTGIFVEIGEGQPAGAARDLAVLVPGVTLPSAEKIRECRLDAVTLSIGSFDGGV